MSNKARPEAYTVIQKQIGERIEWARELVEPNRAEFARLMGVDRSTLSKIESGERPPSVFNVLDIAHRLRLTTDYILCGSMRGVDGELAAKLAVRHPELLNPQPASWDDTPSTATGSGTSPKPKKPKRRA